MTSTASTCPALSPQPVTAGWLNGLLSRWTQMRARQREKTELLALTELSEHTLDDINAPCWMYLEAKAQREAERQRVESFRMGSHQAW
ncbi:MAG: hypothetical protein IV092_14605 [Burkholderiaceae bacterium]|nr:hypothetical protein [Burkholderiaceae bacterium]